MCICIHVSLNTLSHAHIFLLQVRQPLGALRTFGKLLLRRLERTDAEGLNQELTGNVLVSSDELVAVLRRYEGHESSPSAADVDADTPAAGALTPSASASSSSSSSSSTSSRKALCDPRAVLAPVVAAARAISGRDGVEFRTLVAEGLPRVRIGDERGFQEALGTMVELALASSLAGAAAAEEGSAPPRVSLEVASSGLGGSSGDGGGGGVQFIVRDNGLGVLRGGRELGRAREAIERMGGRMDVRRSVSLGGTHMAVLFGGPEGVAPEAELED